MKNHYEIDGNELIHWNNLACGLAPFLPPFANVEDYRAVPVYRCVDRLALPPDGSRTLSSLALAEGQEAGTPTSVS